jgi:predicted amidohydrolase
MGDQYPTIRAAAIQATPAFLDRKATVEEARRLIEEAGGAGRGSLCFPNATCRGSRTRSCSILRMTAGRG